MNKIWLIIQREFLNRVLKRSFLIATIVIPLIFPTIVGLLAYASKEESSAAKKEVIYYIDKSQAFTPDTSRFVFKSFSGTLEEAKQAFQYTQDFALLYIPAFDLSQPEGITLYTKINPGIEEVKHIESMLEGSIKNMKMQRMNIDQNILNSLQTKVNINTVQLSEDGKEAPSNSIIMSGIGIMCGIMMYMFIFIYGAQIMQGVIEEKTSKVVEIIISSVRPFQLMMGKIIGLASVGLLQFLIWIILISTLTFGVLGYLGIDPPQQQLLQQLSNDTTQQQVVMDSEFKNGFNELLALPLTYILFCFLFYFIGGYLLYGALFAAVGSSVDSSAEGQQFMFPLTIPLFISYVSLFMNPHGTVSFWLSIIPFTSPIAMISRIPFGVPLWELLLSMSLLVTGFLLTTWIAARIYRIGILMHGTKVNYKVLVKWFMMKG